MQIVWERFLNDILKIMVKNQGGLKCDGEPGEEAAILKTDAEYGYHEKQQEEASGSLLLR
jgi:tetrahydromethanopterin S-methyltransferase subunit H